MAEEGKENAQPGGDAAATGFLGIPQERLDGFTYRAMRSLRAARDEAGDLGHERIAPEHLLLGVLSLEEGVGAIALRNLGVDLAELRSRLATPGSAGSASSPAAVGLTSEADRVLERTVDEANRLGHSHIGTEHILLGLVSNRDGAAANVLLSFGVDLDTARAEVRRVLESWDPRQMQPRRPG